MRIKFLPIIVIMVIISFFFIFENWADTIFAQDSIYEDPQSIVTLEMKLEGTQSISNYSKVVGFNTNFTVVGSNSNLIKEMEVIKNTISDNFKGTPSIGYIRVDNVNEIPSNVMLSNPFANKQQINDKISLEFDNAIKEVPNSDSVVGIIDCRFGMKLTEFQCSYSSILT
jgi:hypothetical protein